MSDYTRVQYTPPPPRIPTERELIASLDNELSTVRAQVSSLERDHAARLRQERERHDGLIERFDEQDALLDQLHQQHEVLDANFRRLHGTQARQARQLGAQATRLDGHDAQLSDLDADVQRLDARADAADARHSAHVERTAEELSLIRQRAEQLRTELFALNERTGQRLSSLQRSLDTYQVEQAQKESQRLRRAEQLRHAGEQRILAQELEVAKRIGRYYVQNDAAQQHLAAARQQLAQARSCIDTARLAESGDTGAADACIAAAAGAIQAADVACLSAKEFAGVRLQRLKEFEQANCKQFRFRYLPCTDARHPIVLIGEDPMSTPGKPLTITASVDAEGTLSWELSRSFGASCGQMKRTIDENLRRSRSFVDTSSISS